VIGYAILALAGSGVAQEFHPDIPKAWDDKAVESFEMPPAQRDRSPRYMTAEEYYKLEVRPIYRSYPMYVKGREPAGYIESLKQKEPEIIFDPAKLHTKEDWIAAGKLVFESEVFFNPAPTGGPTVLPSLPVSSDGVLPSFYFGFRYIVRKEGKLEVGLGSCAECHTRVMQDGSLFEGAQGVVPQPVAASRIAAIRDSTPEAFQRILDGAWSNDGSPRIVSREEFQKSISKDEYVRRIAAFHPGVLARQGTSSSHPPHIPSLIGIQDISYLDATGLSRNRSIGDVMRYAIVNQGLDSLAHYGDFQPSAESAAFAAGTRYSDEQLYALALYLYSLKPPPNPNPIDERARHGQQIFQQQGCAGCHTPPLYTNNKLTPAQGFEVPDDLLKTGDILNVSVGTDPTLALQTRRGTGFYKVPSLRGVWYRNAFGHGGWAETLEEWFDPERLKDDYLAKGFHLGAGPIKGHEFGLRLAPDDKQALIAFLRTL
jgi:mono/diheme cytochrome c family protein